jgi:hypothetical protein
MTRTEQSPIQACGHVGRDVRILGRVNLERSNPATNMR